MIKFYDTSSLLLNLDNLFEDEAQIYISSITLEELEHIKTSANKDADIKYSARQLINLLDQHRGQYQVVFFSETMLNPFITHKMTQINNDLKILGCALYIQQNNPNENFVFITNDIFLKHFALFFLSDNQVISIEDKEEYSGYKDIVMTEEEMNTLYSNLDKNIYNLLINQYLIVRNEQNEVVDKLCWTEKGYRHINYENFSSYLFGNVKPMKDDPYQALLADSLINNTITLIKGPAGSGKTYLSLAFLLHKLEKHEIDKIIIFCNTVATKDSAKLGLIMG